MTADSQNSGSGTGKFRLLIKNMNVNTKVSEIKKFFLPIRIKDAKILKRGVAVAYFKTHRDLEQALTTRGEIHGSTVSIQSYENDLFINDVKPCDSKRVWATSPADQLISEIKENGRLFVRNLSYECTEEDLISLFSPHGTVSEVHLSYDTKLNKSKGFAFVTFLFPADAVTAFQKLDKQKFKGRLLHILPGKDRPVDEDKPKHPNSSTTVERLSADNAANADGEDNHDESTDPSLSEFQRKKLVDLKATASVSHNWNTLFINPDAVSQYLAAKFGVSKEQLLDSTGKESAAVRLAHGEAQLIHELRIFLLKAGVRIDLFEGAGPSDAQGRRDRTEVNRAATHRQLSGQAFIIKNLPVGTKEVEISDLIQRLTKNGGNQLPPPRRIILPPLGITAIIDYEIPQVAKMAYKALAYEPFKGNILFLQWAPDGILSPKKDEEASDIEASEKTDGREIESKRTKKRNIEPAENMETLISMDESAMEDQTVTEESEPVTESKKCKRRRKVENAPAAESAEDGPKSKAHKEAAAAITNASENRVLLVRNVAFQASEAELTSLFKPISGLLKVRMPKKVSGGHRGFAFVEFVNNEQAETALQTFGADTHFYGRRLNIEYAKSSG
uniref:Putative RNA-binding protein 19 n=2 Tax=Schistocephalus solidus TaxID=70667 RepID=A0A0X3NHW1_SCHSO